ncbi:hypothetical protein CYMTET_24107, partial [Cymbomonas tetramitiformis]
DDFARSMVNASGGVIGAGDVVIQALEAGSVVVTSTTYHPAGMETAAATLMATMVADAASIFASFLSSSTYGVGSVTTEYCTLSTHFASPPPPPTPPPPSPPPLPPLPLAPSTSSAPAPPITTARKQARSRLRAAPVLHLPVVADVVLNNLDLHAFDDPSFSASFHLEYEAQMAMAAGVESSDVTISSITAASIIVTSIIVFPTSVEQMAVQSFVEALTSHPDTIFTASSDQHLFADYGPFVTEQVDTQANVMLVEDLVTQDDSSATVADLEAPAITLNGADVLRIPQLGVYVELGATAVDAVSGCLEVVSSGGESLNLRNVTDGPPHAVQYSVEDSAGNTGTRTRWVVVEPRCEAPSFLCPEATPERPLCATCVEGGACLCLEDVSVPSQGLTRAPGGYSPLLDVRAPSLSLQGDGMLGKSAEGIMVMTESVEVRTPSALLSGLHAQGCQAGRVDQCTHPEHAVLLELFLSFVFEDTTVTETDASGGVALSDSGAWAWDSMEERHLEGASQQSHFLKRSRLRLQRRGGGVTENPWLVRFDVDDSAGNVAIHVERRVMVVRSCGNVERLCGDEVCSSSGLCRMEPPAPTTLQEKRAPVITLVGPAEVAIPQGQAYFPCHLACDLSLVCDQGVDAVDELEGRLQQYVLACGQPFREWGLRGCGITVESPPGRYTVTFTVSNSAGHSASVSRSVLVQAQCLEGEFLCDNQVDCSQGGSCPMADPTAASNELGDEENQRPSIRLRTRGAVQSRYVSVEQGAEYAMCTAEELAGGGGETLCEPGVDSADGDGVDLTDQVVVCPPEECIRRGCPGHEVKWKGLRPCINTSAAVGSSYDVAFMVVDRGHMPLRNATVVRTVTIVAPCPIGTMACSIHSGESFCSATPCSVLVGLSGESEQAAPVVALLGPKELRLPYGSGANLRACSALSSASLDSCYAIARDGMGGDLSSSIVMEVDNTVADTAESACVIQLLLRGRCMPGRYRYVYWVQDRDGNFGEVRLAVSLVEAGTVTATVALQAAELATEEDLRTTAEALLSPGSAQSAAFRGGLAEALAASSSSPGGVTATDVAITDVRIGSTWQLLVSFTVMVYVDPAIGKGDGSSHLSTAADPVLKRAAEEVRNLEEVSAEGGSLGGHLEAAAERNGAEGLPTGVRGMVGEAAMARMTEAVPVDAELAAHSLAEQLVELSVEHGRLGVTLSRVEGLVVGSGGDPESWKLSLEEEWTAKLEAEVDNVEALLSSVQAARAGAGQQVAHTELMFESLVEAQTRVEKNMEAMLAQLAGGEEEEECQRLRAEKRVNFAFVPGAAAYEPNKTDAGGRRRLAGLASTLKLPGQQGHQRSFSKNINWERPSAFTSNYQEHTDWSLETAAGHPPSGVRAKTESQLKHYVGLSGSNRLIGGWPIAVERRAQTNLCTRGRYPQLAGRACPLGIPLQGSYGIDPVFSMASALYRPDLQEDISQYYDTSPGSTEVYMLGTVLRPHPFSVRTMRSQSGNYVSVLDAGLTAYRAQQVYTFLADSRFLDDATTKITVQLLTYNPMMSVWSTSYVTWERGGGGSWHASFDEFPVSIPDWRSYVQEVEGVLWVGLLLVWVAVSLYMAYREFTNFVRSVLEDQVELHQHPAALPPSPPFSGPLNPSLSQEEPKEWKGSAWSSTEGGKGAKDLL